MLVKKQFLKNFTTSNLQTIFADYVSLSGATGIDNLNQIAFKPKLEEQTEIISRKVTDGTYSFSKYKLKLISKGRGKIPREISIPSVRDRIALRALCDFLSERFKTDISFELPQKVIRSVKNDLESESFDAFIKLDVADFYPSIKHDELIRRLRKRIKNASIIDLISSAIKSPTVTASKTSDLPNLKGVPQGLAVSNVLAAIYLSNLDKALAAYSEAECYRYVDDVLILCKSADAKTICSDITRRFGRLGLRVYDPEKHPDKSHMGEISERFDYLGYQFESGTVTVRIGSLERLKASLVSIFTSYKHSKRKSEDFLLWRLNLRITGCIFQNRSKGWLFFFSEITDEALLHRLDHYVAKLLTRFSVEITPKKFVRAYHELKHRRYETNYIPNFDEYSLDEKRSALTDYFGLTPAKIADMTDEEVEHEFLRRINKQVKDLLEDLQGLS